MLKQSPVTAIAQTVADYCNLGGQCLRWNKIVQMYFDFIAAKWFSLWGVILCTVKIPQLPEIINTSAREQTVPSGNKPCHITGVDCIKYEFAVVEAHSVLYGFYSALAYDAVINKMVDETNKY